MRKDTTKVCGVLPRARKLKHARPRHLSESKFVNAERADDIAEFDRFKNTA